MPPDEDKGAGAPAWVQFLRQDITEARRALEQYRLEASQRYITKEEFAPVKSLVYGLVAIALTGLVTALLALVINNGN